MATQTSQTDGDMHQSEAPGGVGGARDAQANAAGYAYLYPSKNTGEEAEEAESWKLEGCCP